MSGHDPIDPGPGHLTIFMLEGDAVAFRTMPRRTVPAAGARRADAPPAAPGRPPPAAPPGGPVAAPAGPAPVGPRKPERGPDIDPGWIVPFPGLVAPLSDIDPGWSVPWPAIAPDRFTIFRSFTSLQAAEDAAADVARLAASAASGSADRPHVVLAMPHGGAFQPDQAERLLRLLHAAGATALLVVGHEPALPD